jgi:hypothetical protein
MLGLPSSERRQIDLVANQDDFTTRLMNDMDPDLLAFVKAKVNSFIKWDLIRLFYENPQLTDTVEEIAIKAGRPATAVKPELEDMVESGMMEKGELEGISVYSLAENEDMRELVDRFILASEDRHFRVKAVYHIIRGMR